MALTPQEIATGVLNSDRTVADVQSIRAANLPYGAYESLLQQARRNEERMANNVTSSQIEAGYGQQSRPDVTGLANREMPSYTVPKRPNVRPNKPGVFGGRLRGKGSAGATNEPVKTMTTQDGKGIITDGNLNEEMAKANASPKSAPSQTSSESEADSSIIPALIMSGLLGTAGGSALYALPKMLNAIDESAKAATAEYNKKIGYGESKPVSPTPTAKPTPAPEATPTAKPTPVAEATPTAKAPAPSAAAKLLGLVAAGLSGKGGFDALGSVVDKVHGGKSWNDYNSMNAGEEVADGFLNPIVGMVGADDPARKTMALLRALFDANNAEDYANFERWERERQERKARMANKDFWDYINPLNIADTAGDLLVPIQDAVDYLVNDYDWGSNAAEKVWSEAQKKR